MERLTVICNLFCTEKKERNHRFLARSALSISNVPDVLLIDDIARTPKAVTSAMRRRTLNWPWTLETLERT